MKDHEIAKLVNEATAIAKEFGRTEQLRERLSQLLAGPLKGTPPIPVEDYQSKYRHLHVMNADEKYGYESCRYEFMANGGFLKTIDRDAFEIFVAEYYHRHHNDDQRPLDKILEELKRTRTGDFYINHQTVMSALWATWQKAKS